MNNIKTLFNIGDKIVYPGQGIGVVDCIEEMEFKGEKQNYYKIDIVNSTMKLSNINANEKQVLNSTKSLVVEEISQSKDLSREEASELLENAIRF